MTGDWSMPAWAAVGALALVALLGVAVVLLAVGLGRVRAQARRAQDAVEALAVRLDDERTRRLAQEKADAAASARAADPFLITDLGTQREEPAPDAPVVDAPLFADLVLREAAVQAGSLAAGLRRALAPETRYRIRAEVRREVRRARKQRKVETRLARRAWAARERAAGGDAAGSAA
ncbi:hypothetical protein [Nocardioides sp. GY 10127]|uniref:hypothetical protein n=1 Tax=Nocardioides sp. GY 10127 TaxID=2569762 RepID=UPI0010A8F48D|nr:hypothetical protein [Nocardioides sp. GY 10127]TIC85494.1 hypothetical protein E8D37_02330 [Nocardioides sp. GY 10127]